MTEKIRCKMCGCLLRYPEDAVGLAICGQPICGDCEPWPRGKIREYFRMPRGAPGRREAPPGGCGPEEL